MLGEVAAHGGDIAHLRRADLPGGLGESGKHPPQLGVRRQRGQRDTGADGPLVRRRRDFLRTGQHLHVHEQPWLGDVLLEFAEQIDATGDEPALVADELDRGFRRLGDDVGETFHA